MYLHVLRRMMAAPWGEHLTFLPEWGGPLADQLHEVGFILDSTTFSYRSFGSREVLFWHPHAKLWVKCSWLGKEQVWECLLAHDKGGRPGYFMAATDLLAWLGSPAAGMENVNSQFAENIREIIHAAARMDPVAMIGEVMPARNHDTR